MPNMITMAAWAGWFREKLERAQRHYRDRTDFAWSTSTKRDFRIGAREVFGELLRDRGCPIPSVDEIRFVGSPGMVKLRYSLNEGKEIVLSFDFSTEVLYWQIYSEETPSLLFTNIATNRELRTMGNPVVAMDAGASLAAVIGATGVRRPVLRTQTDLETATFIADGVRRSGDPVYVMDMGG